MKQSKAAQALAYLRSLVSTDLAEQVELKDYEAKDGTKISTDADGKVQGDVKDGDYELADGSTLAVKDGIATEKPASEAPDKKEEAAAADDSAPTADDAPAAGDEAQADDQLKQSIDALTAAIQQLISGMGLKDQELAEAKTKLAEAEQKIEEADKRPIDQKPGVGLGLSAIQDEPKLSKAQRALAAARAQAR